MPVPPKRDNHPVVPALTIFGTSGDSRDDVERQHQSPAIAGKDCVEGASEVASAEGDITDERLAPSAFTDSRVVLRKMRVVRLGNDASEERDQPDYPLRLS
ncbi:hypothetical protein MTO96_051614 [Rhipicephalus appendiculatus]